LALTFRWQGLGRCEDTAMSKTEVIRELTAIRPWNKGRLSGQKRPLRPRDVWAIRTRLEIANNKRNLALFNLAIDSKLRACDLVSLRVSDIQTAERIHERACIIQKKTGLSVQFELTEITRFSVSEWLQQSNRAPSDFLFLAALTVWRIFQLGSMPG
jgi:integrase